MIRKNFDTKVLSRFMSEAELVAFNEKYSSALEVKHSMKEATAQDKEIYAKFTTGVTISTLIKEYNTSHSGVTGAIMRTVRSNSK